jgi:hypothetical protein
MDGVAFSDTRTSVSNQRQVLGYFSSNYAESRRKFLDAAKAADATIESLRHPSVGPDGASLFTDVAVMGSSSANAVMFVGAGTHGVEAFAGSAIQTGLLRQGYGTQLGDKIRLVLIHGINPYGFAHLRRANEGNVDLNRNFRDHYKTYPTNAGYGSLATAIAPASTSLLSDIKGVSRILSYAVRHGWTAAQTAITAGQYSHPKGLFYGGHAESWSAITLRTIVQRHGFGANRVAFVDVHTGLGPRGNAEVILNVPKRSAAYERAATWWGNIVRSTKTGRSVSADLAGTLKLAIPEMLPGAEVTAVSLEFGTVPSLVALRALRVENWLYHHGDKELIEADRIKTDLLRAFYPDDEDWRVTVWRKGQDAMDKGLRGLSEPSSLRGRAEAGARDNDN